MPPKGKIYCISGLGADEMVFQHLRIEGYTLEYLPWLPHKKKEKLKDYSMRMAELITDPRPVILGVSLGGMIGIEIARLRPVKKLIIISGIKTRGELPTWMRVAGTLQLNKWMPVRSNKVTKRYDNRMLGVTTPREEKMVNVYRRRLDRIFQLWAINEILNWKNKWYPEGTVHIHGEYDRMFPLKNINPTFIIKEGTHMMIMSKANEISQCINASLLG